MNCLDPKPPEIAEIIQGEDELLVVQVFNKKTGEFFDLTGATEIDCVFFNQDMTCLHKKLSVVGEVVILNALAGKFTIAITAADSALLKLSDANGYSSFEATIEIAGKKTKVQFKNSYKVIASLIPSGC